MSFVQQSAEREVEKEKVTDHVLNGTAGKKDVTGVNQVSITGRDYFLINIKGFNFYGIELRKADNNRLRDIISGCEAVESNTWNAQEDFFSYIKKSDLLIYAEKNGQIIGFCLVSLMLINEYCFFTNDETMVLRAFQGDNIAVKIVTVTLLYFMKKINLGKSIKKFIMVSISANPHVINMYYSNKWNNFVSSFHPTQELVDIHRAYLNKYNMTLVDERFPFCVKSAFPGSQQLDWCKKKYQFRDEIKKLFPSDFDYKNRGDAWAFMFLAKMRSAYINFTYMAVAFIGVKAFFNKNIGLLRRKKRLVTGAKLTRIRLVEENLIDRRMEEMRRAAAE